MIHFSFIHWYINLDNIAWASTSRQNLKKNLLSKNMLFDNNQVFFNAFEEIERKYLTRLSNYDFKQPSGFKNCTKFSLS